MPPKTGMRGEGQRDGPQASDTPEPCARSKQRTRFLHGGIAVSGEVFDIAIRIVESINIGLDGPWPQTERCVGVVKGRRTQHEMTGQIAKLKRKNAPDRITNDHISAAACGQVFAKISCDLRKIGAGKIKIGRGQANIRQSAAQWVIMPGRANQPVKSINHNALMQAHLCATA